MAKVRSVLGKGLSALIPTSQEGTEAVEDIERDLPQSREARTSALARPEPAPRPEPSVSKIEIARVAPNPQQPRKDFPKEALDELAQSIKEHGVIQAITVRRVAPDRYELISGERRVRASIEAGLTDIPAYVIEVESDVKMLELAIIENVQRLQFNPIEEAEAYQRLIEDCGLTQEDVAEKIARDRSTVTNFLRLLRLPQPIKDSLRNGALGMGHAKAIMSVPESTEQVRLWNEAVQNQYSVRKLEELARSAASKDGNGAPRSTKSAKSSSEKEGYASSAEVTSVENTFKQLLGTQVKLRVKPDHSGEIAIHFYSFDDLERLRELLESIPHT